MLTYNQTKFCRSFVGVVVYHVYLFIGSENKTKEAAAPSGHDAGAGNCFHSDNLVKTWLENSLSTDASSTEVRENYFSV